MVSKPCLLCTNFTLTQLLQHHTNISIRKQKPKESDHVLTEEPETFLCLQIQYVWILPSKQLLFFFLPKWQGIAMETACILSSSLQLNIF